MDRNQLALEKLYENLRLVCYQLPNFLSDIENEFYPKTESDRIIISSIKNSLQKCIDNIFDAANLLCEILNDEDEMSEGN
jgi:hypothetical protein